LNLIIKINGLGQGAIFRCKELLILCDVKAIRRAVEPIFRAVEPILCSGIGLRRVVRAFVRNSSPPHRSEYPLLRKV
jgi:hypothetical protein